MHLPPAHAHLWRRMAAAALLFALMGAYWMGLQQITAPSDDAGRQPPPPGLDQHTPRVD